MLTGGSRLGPAFSYQKESDVKHTAILLIVILASGCTFMHQDFANYRKNYDRVNLRLLTIGDDKKEVINKLGEPVNVIGSKNSNKVP